MKAAIVGAGLVGRLLAWRLQRAGWQLDIFEQSAAEDNASCAYVAAGMLAPIAELDKSVPLIAEMGLKSLALWPQWLAELRQPVEFHRAGSLVTAHASDQIELQHYAGRLERFAIAQDQFEWCGSQRIVDLEPELSTLTQAIYLPTEGQIDNQALLTALHVDLTQAGVTWYWSTPVQTVAPHQVTTASETQTYDWVFDCRGLGAKADIATLRGVRGEVIWLHAPAVNLSRPVRYLHPRYSIYIVPRVNQQYIIGASEIDAEDHSPISVRSALELLTAAYSLHRGFAEARIQKTATHCRPTFADHNPQVMHESGLTAINGLFRHGFLIAPYLVEQVLEGVTDD